MEIKEIVNITYELFRIKEDRLCMGYEDQISASLRKYERLNSLLGSKKKEFDELLRQVEKIIGTFGNTNNAGVAGSEQSSSTAVTKSTQLTVPKSKLAAANSTAAVSPISDKSSISNKSSNKSHITNPINTIPTTSSTSSNGISTLKGSNKNVEVDGEEEKTNLKKMNSLTKNNDKKKNEMNQELVPTQNLPRNTIENPTNLIQSDKDDGWISRRDATKDTSTGIAPMTVFNIKKTTDLGTTTPSPAKLASGLKGTDETQLLSDLQKPSFFDDVIINRNNPLPPRSANKKQINKNPLVFDEIEAEMPSLMKMNENEEENPKFFDNSLSNKPMNNQAQKRKYELISSPLPNTKPVNPELTFVNKYKFPSTEANEIDPNEIFFERNEQSKINLPNPLKETKVEDPEEMKRKIQRMKANLSPSSNQGNGFVNNGPLESSSSRTTGEERSNAAKSNKLTRPPQNQSKLKCVEVIRKKDERDALPGHLCEQCAAFYQVQKKQGIITRENYQELLKACSRHKAKNTPPATPETFWDLSIRTPDEWKQK